MPVDTADRSSSVPSNLLIFDRLWYSSRRSSATARCSSRAVIFPSASSLCRWRTLRTSFCILTSWFWRRICSASARTTTSRCSQHLAGEALKLLGEVDRLLHPGAEPVVGQRRVQLGDDAGEIEAGRRRRHQQGGVDRRLEQRQRALDAVD